MSLLSMAALFLAAGVAGGLLLGLIGVGMALIAVPVLTLCLPSLGVPVESAPLTALGTSMAVVTLGSVSSVYSHARLGNVNWSIVRTTTLFSLIGVMMGSLGATQLPGQVLKWVLCLFLAVLGVRMFLSGQTASARNPDDTAPWVYKVAGTLVGMAGSLIGAGGGVFLVPFLNGRGHSMRSAIATSMTIGMPVSLLGSVIYGAQPSPRPDLPMIGYILVPAFLGLSIGSIAAAPFGARLASRIPTKHLKQGFALTLLLLVGSILLQ